MKPYLCGDEKALTIPESSGCDCSYTIKSVENKEALASYGLYNNGSMKGDEIVVPKDETLYDKAAVEKRDRQNADSELRISIADLNSKATVLENRLNNLTTGDAGIVTTLWTGALALGSGTATLSESKDNFDYIDIYQGNKLAARVAVTSGSQTVEVDNAYVSNYISDDVGTIKTTTLVLNGTSASVSTMRNWTSNSSSAEQIPITRIDGVKSNSGSYESEVQDIRTGYDGTVYQSAGDAVRAQAFRGTDKTLAVSGMAADAKAVGDDITNLKSDLSDLDNAVFNITEESINKFNSALVTSATVSTDKKLYGNGTLRDATGIDVSPFMPIKPSTAYWFGLVPPYGNAGVPWYGQSVAIEFYSAQSEDSQISRIDRSDNNPITFTTPSNAMFYRFNINRGSGITTTLLSQRCMLVEGSTAPSEFEPYSEYRKESKLTSIQDEIDTINSKVDQLGTPIKHHLIGTIGNGNVLIRNGTTVYDAQGLTHSVYTGISNHVGKTVYITGKSNTIGNDGKAYVLYGFYDSDNNLLLYHESTANTYYSDVQVLIPANASKLIVNGITGNASGTPSVVILDSTSTTNGIAYEKYNGTLYVTTKYNLGTLDIEFGKRGPNQLPDFKKITAEGRAKYTGSSDMHSPFTIKAVNNIDGDDVANHTYTGGNHNYGNTGTTDYTATGRNISFDLYADGELLTDGDFGLATTIMIEWVNRVQGYNTRKSDGSGREIIEERHTIVFDGVNWVSTVELEPLEDVVIENYYGYQCPVSNYPNIHMIGADYKKEFVYSSPHDSGNNTPNMYVACSSDDRLEMEVDRSYDMGKGSYYSGTQGFRTISSGKGYTFLIGNLTAEGGDILGARGIYRFIPNY